MAVLGSSRARYPGARGRGLAFAEAVEEPAAQLQQGLAAALQECPHTGLLVLGGEEIGEDLALEDDARAELPSRPPVQRDLGGPQRVRRSLRVPSSQGHGTVEHFVRRKHLVDEPDREGLVRAEVPARVHHVLGSSQPDEPGQPLRPACARDDAEKYLGLTEARVLAGDPVVGAHRQLEAAAKAEPRDGRDRRDRDLFELIERILHLGDGSRGTGKNEISQ